MQIFNFPSQCIDNVRVIFIKIFGYDDTVQSLIGNKNAADSVHVQYESFEMTQIFFPVVKTTAML